MELKATRDDLTDGVAAVTLVCPSGGTPGTAAWHRRPLDLREAYRDPTARLTGVTGDPQGNAFCAGRNCRPWRATPRRAATTRDA